MAYYTDFRIKTNPPLANTKICESLVTNEKGHCEAWEWKWYDYDDDLRKVSHQYPDVVFCVDGDGEEAGDLWRRYYKAGKCWAWHADIGKTREAIEFGSDVLKEEE